jgi:molecular chaperone GrpE
MPEEKTIIEANEDASVDIGEADRDASLKTEVQPEPTVAELQALLQCLTRDKERLVSEKASLQDMLLRRQADFENFRRRTERERAESRELAGLEVIQALLPVLDDFQRALGAAGNDETGAVREYTKGIELIHQQLVDTLTKLGLEPIPSVGERFDPNLHNGIMREDREDVEDHTVVEEFRRGYNFKGRLLRPALVKVAVKP